MGLTEFLEGPQGREIDEYRKGYFILTTAFLEDMEGYGRWAGTRRENTSRVDLVVSRIMKV